MSAPARSGPRPAFAARLAWAALLVLALLPALASRARAADAAPDTTVEGYVRQMADSTDAWFGLSAQPADTAGLDSVRTWVIGHPGKSTRRRGGRVSFAPLLSFNRAIGGALGGEAFFGPARRVGRVSASAQWTTGADTWFGGGEYLKRWARPGQDDDEAGAVLSLRAGRAWGGLDRDYHEPVFGAARAFLTGTDRSSYLRRDGARFDLLRRSAPGWIGVGARDELESPLATTATWYLTGHDPVVVRNDSARAGRVHEIDARAGLRLGRLPFTLEGHAWSAGGALGGDLDYTRMRFALGGAVGLGRHIALAPEVEYGRITGSAPPQDAFYMGGGTLRSLDAQQLQGAGRALAHADFIVLDPVQALLGFDRAPTFPVQVGAFGGLGAVGGRDPATGIARVTPDAFPNRRDWLAEVGLSVLYRPGLPDPDSYVRLDWAVPIGADGRSSRLYVSFMRALNFLRKP